MRFCRLTLICGHYGCGKTNLSLNIAIDQAKKGESVTLVDLDIVNPYFRSSDYIELLERHGIRLIAPNFARSALDVPSLPAAINSVFEQQDGFVLFDVGGDDVGATALGRYAGKFSEQAYEMIYVINKYRPMTHDAPSAVEHLREIEAASHLRAGAIINNSHLMMNTTADTICSALPYAEETAKTLQLPIKCTTAPRSIAGELDIENLYPVDIYVRTPWM